MILKQSLINWCKEGSMLLTQEPTHILNLSSSFIDLIFTSQSNLVMESEGHSSLHRNCYHQLVFAKFNLSILYPPPYKRIVWFYEKPDAELVWT